MNSNNILALYWEIYNLKPIDLSWLVEHRLDLLLTKYDEALQGSLENIKQYDTLEVIRGLNKNAKLK